MRNLLCQKESNFSLNGKLCLHLGAFSIGELLSTKLQTWIHTKNWHLIETNIILVFVQQSPERFQASRKSYPSVNKSSWTNGQIASEGRWKTITTVSSSPACVCSPWYPCRKRHYFLPTCSFMHLAHPYSPIPLMFITTGEKVRVVWAGATSSIDNSNTSCSNQSIFAVLSWQSTMVLDSSRSQQENLPLLRRSSFGRSRGYIYTVSSSSRSDHFSFTSWIFSYPISCTRTIVRPHLLITLPDAFVMLRWR